MKIFLKVLAALIFLNSCNFKPKYTRPEMDLVESFRFIPENAVEYANLPWWEQLGDPVLNELIGTALKYNHNIAIATATVSQFYAAYQIAFSELLPQIEGLGNEESTYWKAKQPRHSYLYQLFMNLSYELDLWGKIRNAVESAQATYLSAIDTRLNIILSIVSGIAKAYILMLQYDNQLAVSLQTLAGRKELYRISYMRYKAGIISLLDLKQAEAQLEDAEVQVKRFQGLIPIQEDLISILMGKQPGPIPRGNLLKKSVLPPEIPAGLPSDLLENRPDIMAAEQNLIAANAQIGVARAAFFPVFEITGFQGKQSLLFKDIMSSLASYSQWNFDITQPLYTGGALTGQLAEAEAVYLENFHAYQQTVLTALAQVSDSLVAHETAKEAFEIQKKEVASYETYLKLAKIRYYNGLNDYLSVEIAEQNLFGVQLFTEETRGIIFLTLVDIYTSLGQGWDVEADYCPKCDNPNPLWKAIFLQ